MSDACPYCGELLELPAPRCPRCDAVLEEPEDGGLDLVELTDDELDADGFDDIEEAAAARPSKRRKVATEPCPHCDKPVPVNKHRCPACGRALRELVDDEVWQEQARYRQRLRLAAVGAVLAIALVFVVGGALRGLGGGSRPQKKEYVRVPLEEMVTFYGRESKLGEEQRQRLWAKHEKSFVVWNAVVIERTEGGLFSDPELLVRSESDPAIEVRIRLDPEADPKGAAPGDRVRIEGRLVAYGGSPLFQLDWGSVVAVRGR